MITIETGIGRKEYKRFQEYCEDNDIMIEHTVDMGNYIFVSVAIDARKADSLMDEFNL